MSEFVVRRRHEAFGTIPERFQWISHPGYITVHYGRRVPRLSASPKLTLVESEAYKFSTRAQAQLQVDRYFKWIAKQFEVIKISSKSKRPWAMEVSSPAGKFKTSARYFQTREAAEKMAEMNKHWYEQDGSVVRIFNRDESK